MDLVFGATPMTKVWSASTAFFSISVFPPQQEFSDDMVDGQLAGDGEDAVIVGL